LFILPCAVILLLFVFVLAIGCWAQHINK
jgi:hypothetical protein